MSGDGQLRAFIERILRLKEEQDTLACDIREVYAEAKGSGFDKTAMGQLVAHLRKVEKVGVAAVEEGQTVFDLYLDAYRRATGTGLATHAHEAAGQSYADAKGRGFVADLYDEQKAAALAYDGDDTHGEITEHEQPETAKEFHPPVTAREGHEGDPSPTLGEKDLVEVGTGHNCAVLPQEPYKAPITNPQPSPLSGADKPEAVSPPAVSGALSDDDVPAFLRRDHAPKPAGDKPNCLKLKDGHCKIGFATSALCAECNAAKARVSA
ncbi:MAG: DUF2312 domain-containing protein [Mesorhizobium sp.]